ncbi:hypothetical protein BDY21DRAFT_385177 [Lineolata rhizophorae]|uniref:Uncharacterized protein n=1 Tax=Lineolata rhizophorae TaxID=578093 RepID=A0A6A6P4J1_9PEZI|nr:hypothetical protein BDY21DRAFT_385177 [Lineolata rhizophorae]
MRSWMDVPTRPPSAPIARVARNLRLPSFDLLGIRVPHPDNVVFSPNNVFADVGSGPLSKPEDPLHAESPLGERPGLEKVSDGGGILPPPPPPPPPTERSQPPAKTSVPKFIPTAFTPPDDGGPLNWDSGAAVQAGAMESPANSEAEQAAQQQGGEASSAAQNPPSALAQFQANSERPWISSALQIIYEHEFRGSFRVLSHALPCPCATGHAFPLVINALHEAIPRQSTTWINVFHAVPGRFNMADLPTSPPNTPGPAIGGEDYFSTQVFDSAVPIIDYQGDAKLLRNAPHPVVPPATIDFSIVERYIPPTNAIEFLDLTTITSRSLLLDRLIELSPHNGTLLFIYPTKTGARTFMDDYLGPIIDPLLRSMTVVNGLTADLGTSLGRMRAVSQMLEFEELRSRLGSFCRRLSTTSSEVLRRFHSTNASYSLVHASRHEVFLDRKVWAGDWWIKQEKQRVRDVVSRYYGTSVKSPSQQEAASGSYWNTSISSPIHNPSKYIQEIIDGVEAKQNPDHQPSKGVEVGVFVLRKSL